MKERRWQFDMAVGCTLYRYHRLGLIYLKNWRDNLEVYVETADDFENYGGARGSTNKVASVVVDEEAMKATISNVEKTGSFIPYLPILAVAIRKTLSHCAAEVPPWIEGACGSAETTDWRACKAVLIADHPFDDIIDVDRKIEWKAAPTLWAAPFGGGIDL